MATRVLSLWLPYLATDRIRRAGGPSTPGQRSLPTATCLDQEKDQPLVALCMRAEQAGLEAGMTRQEAVRRIPNLLLRPVDTDGDQRQLRSLLALCQLHTPFAAIDHSFTADRGASLWLDIGNTAHLSGGEANLLARLLGRCRKEGLTAKAAIADHPGSAWAACRFGSDEQRILPANGARVALAPWPVRALRLAETDCARLESAGLERIEHLYALPRRSLSARFGDHVATRLDQALGLVDEPIATDTPLPAQQAQMIFADPITDRDNLPSLIERLLRQLCIGLEAAGLGLRRLTLALYRVDNSAVTCSIGTDRPSRDMACLSELIGGRFDNIDLGFGLERIILDAVEIEPLLPECVSWRGLGTAADDPLPDLAYKNPARDEDSRTCHELSSFNQGGQRTGPFHAAPSMPPFLATGQSFPVNDGAAALAYAAQPEEQPTFEETTPRPLRLLRQPEPIEAIASLPGEPPVLFRWRKQLHKVVGARGPETVAPDWWRLPEAETSPRPKRDHEPESDSSLARDYFAVEDSEGARFWLFREGRYDDMSTRLPRWFLHGVFG